MEALGRSREGRYADSEKMCRDVIETAERARIRTATVAEAWYTFACAEAARSAGRSLRGPEPCHRDGLISFGRTLS